MAGETILIVEDERAVARGLQYGLEKEGFRVLWAETGRKALDVAHTHKPDLILLDIRLPDISGFDVCRQMRKDGLRLPVLFLTARDDELDKVLGLELGADDYVVKPYQLRELIARVRALLRRAYGDLSSASPGQRISFGDIVLDELQFTATKADRVLPLTPIEFRLLHYLLSHPDRPFSRQALVEALWGYDGTIGSDRTVDVHIRHLRQKLEDDPANPRWIVTVRGLGYKFHR